MSKKFTFNPFTSTFDLIQKVEQAINPNSESAVSGKAVALYLANRGITISVDNYNELSTNYSASSYNGYFAWVENNQGTAWLPGALGGTYYPRGLYHSNGTSWTFTASPAQATQSEVNSGSNDDKFVTPLTFNNAVKWTTKENASNKSSLILLGNSDVLFPTQNAVKVYVDNGLSTKQNSVTVSNSITNANFFPTFVNENGALTSLNISSNVYINPNSGRITSNNLTCLNTISTGYLTSAQVTAPYFVSNDGGDNSTSALALNGNNGYGGANYFGAITINNTGGTNGKKFVRINNTGSLEVVNNAYSSTIFSLSDAGLLTVPTISSGNVTSNGNLTVTGTTSATGTVTGNSSTAFKAASSAVNNISLEVANTSALRNTGDVSENYMYFDINTGGTNRGNFRFRGTSSYTTYATITPDGIQASTPYVNKTTYNVSLDSSITVDNYRFRVSNQGGVFPQVQSSTGGNIDSSWSFIASVSGNATETGQNSGTLVANNSWTTLFSNHGLDTRGDTIIVHITDKNAGRIYRVTFIVANNSSNVTGYSIIAERLI